MTSKNIPCWLGIDVGGTTIKAGLYDEQCNELSSGRENLTQLSPKPGYAERDMIVLRDKCYQVIREALSKSGITPSSIKGIAISAQGKGLYPIDKTGRPAFGTNGIISADRRAIDVVKRWSEEHIEQQLYPYTRQALWTGHPVSILRWFKENEPEKYRNIDTVMMPHDYLRFCLTGDKAVELTNISESNLFNMNTEQFDERLAKLTGIEDIMAKLPRIVQSTEQCGTVNKEAAEHTGLAEGTPVFGGLFDVDSVAITSGLVDGNSLNVSIGTWSVTTGLATELSDKDVHPFVYGRHPARSTYIIHEASPTSSGNLEWVCRNLCCSDFTKINAMVKNSLEKKNDVFFLPFLYGSNASLDATAGFYGLQAAHDSGDLFAACYEGVVFAGMKHINSLKRKFTNVKKLVVTGGPTHSRIWMQILSDTAQLPLELPKLEEPGCLGAALVAMAGTDFGGDVNKAQSRLRIESSTIEPDKEKTDYYKEKLFRYNLLVEAINSYHEKLNDHKKMFQPT
ncbi:MAG: carbohydrate kinase [Succinivibrio sp.]|nr:carbohydrate kinase [Succinivibrio sp.]